MKLHEIVYTHKDELRCILSLCVQKIDAYHLFAEAAEMTFMQVYINGKQ